MHSKNNTDRITQLFAELFALIADQQSIPVPAPRTSPEQILLTVEEAARKLRIGRTRMFALIKSGEIEAVQIGRSRRIHPEAIEQFAQKLQSRTRIEQEGKS